jgi:hypothetical protein
MGINNLSRELIIILVLFDWMWLRFQVQHMHESIKRASQLSEDFRVAADLLFWRRRWCQRTFLKTRLLFSLLNCIGLICYVPCIFA